MERGVPKPQPLTQAQIAEREAIKEITYNQRGVPKSQLLTKGILQSNQGGQSGEPQPKFKTRGQLLDEELVRNNNNLELRDVEDEYEPKDGEDIGPMSLTINTRRMNQNGEIDENADFEQ